MRRFEDYKQEVILTYKKRRDEGKLPHNLQYFTPANLKKECLIVFPDRYAKNDEETFKSLLNVKRNSAEEYLKQVTESNPNIFKPLCNFLKGSTVNIQEINISLKGSTVKTHKRNIELLAWLIDFQPRPHLPADMGEVVKSEWESSVNKTKDVSKKEPEEDKTVDIVQETKEEFSESEPSSSTNKLLDSNNTPEISETIKEEFQEPVSTLTVNGLLDNRPVDTGQKIGNGKFGFPRKFNKAVISFFAAFVIVGGSYFFYDKSNQCMYWNGDEYLTVACDQKIEGANILPRDTFRLKQLKRIKNISEITRGDIGKVYYSKVNGKVEFYTINGAVDVDTSSIENPTDSRKRLLPLSEHMYIEYVEGIKD